jgi:uncharacterized protein (TIGR02246 family)
MKTDLDSPQYRFTNNMANRVAAGVAALLLFCASAVWSGATSGDKKLDKAIAKANSDWAAAMKTGDSAIIAEPYWGDAVFVALDGSCTKGRVEIEKMYKTRFERSGLAVSTKIESRRVDIEGDLAYESGYGEVGTTKDGETTVNGGPYLTVWQRRTGEWKILRNLVLP